MLAVPWRCCGLRPLGTLTVGEDGHTVTQSSPTVRRTPPTVHRRPRQRQGMLAGNSGQMLN
eukprot:753135-Pyramimonas_sp.AAC.1